MEDNPKISRKLLGFILSIIILMAGVIIYYTLRDTFFPFVPQIEVTDISYDWLPVIGHEWMPPMEVRVTAYVISLEDIDYEIDIKFEAKQNGEETQVKTSTFMIEAGQECEFTVYIMFLNPAKEIECSAQIMQYKAS
jgi:hypothetical protein